MLVVLLRVLRLLEFWHRFWQRLWLGRVRLKGGVQVGGGPGRSKEAHRVRVKTAGEGPFRVTPRARLHSSGRGTLEHGGPVHWGAFERGHQFGAVLVTRVCLHAAVTREAGTAPPLQLRHRFMSHFVKRFVKQTIPEEKRNKSPVSGGGGLTEDRLR